MAMDWDKLIDGLLYPSEEDRPFEAFDWGPVPGPPRAVLARHVAADVTVGEGPAAAFFDPLRDTADAARFAALHRRLAVDLAGLTAFRVADGSAVVAIYLIGRTAAGHWAGVRTASVET